MRHGRRHGRIDENKAQWLRMKSNSGEWEPMEARSQRAGCAVVASIPLLLACILTSLETRDYIFILPRCIVAVHGIGEY